jgi:hypothetical protein
MNFFRYKTATDDAAALEHECRVTRFGEIKGGYESVGTTANDNNIRH